VIVKHELMKNIRRKDKKPCKGHCCEVGVALQDVGWEDKREALTPLLFLPNWRL